MENPIQSLERSRYKLREDTFYHAKAQFGSSVLLSDNEYILVHGLIFILSRINKRQIFQAYIKFLVETAISEIWLQYFRD